MHGFLQFPQRILLGTSNRSNHAGFPPTLLGKYLLSNFHGAHSSKNPKSTIGSSIGFSAISPICTMFLLILQAVLRTLNLYVPLPAGTDVHIHIVLFVIISMIIWVKSITAKPITALGQPYVVNHEFPEGKAIGLRNITNCEDIALYLAVHCNYSGGILVTKESKQSCTRRIQCRIGPPSFRSPTRVSLLYVRHISLLLPPTIKTPSYATFIWATHTHTHTHTH